MLPLFLVVCVTFLLHGCENEDNNGGDVLDPTNPINPPHDVDDGPSAAENPFADKTFYINPANQKSYDASIATSSGTTKTNLEWMKNVPSAYWIDIKEKIKIKTGADAKHETWYLEGILKDAASKSPPPLIVFIWYDLPNRDCHAKASNGEICCTRKTDGSGLCDYSVTGDCADGLKDYRENYADPFVEVLKQYPQVPVVVVVEPDSLPNFATNDNGPSSRCGNSATKAAYKEGIKYAVEKLAETNASIYIDAAHGGWLGWANNLEKFITDVKLLDLPLNKVRGFATNVANYQPIGQQCEFEDEPGQPYRNKFCMQSGKGKLASHSCCADPCGLTSQWNPANNELNYADALAKASQVLLNYQPHMIIDTGRNGAPSSRTSCSNWCNPRGSGAGIGSTAATANKTLVDAYFWLKTPGESDGCTKELPGGGTCPRFDSDCASSDSLGSRTGEPRAPEAGHWFDHQVKELAEFASPGPSR